jgi:pimeloyl-ACP methyl ester carboxylesterase
MTSDHTTAATTQPTTPPTTEHTLDVPGATLSYAVVGDLAAATPDRPPLLLFGSPMDRTGFATLAGHLTDRVLVLLDHRNTGRSTREDPTAAVTPQQHAADLHALVTALGVGPLEAFATSGGAVNALHLVAEHPDDLRLLVAHEPPMTALLPDADAVRAVCDAMVATYDAQGQGPAMAAFISLVMHRGPVAADHADQPGPDPAMFGLPTEDDGSRDDPLMSNMRGGGVTSVPDLDAVRAASTRVVVAVGAESGGPEDGEIAGRSAYALAAALGQDPVVLPGGHNGFLGGEFGQTGEPDAFGSRLREVLAG